MIPRTPIYTLLASLVCLALVIQNVRGSRLFGGSFSSRARSTFFSPQHK